MTTIKSSEVKLLAGFIRNLTGIVLDESKKYLFENRLKPLLEEYHCRDYAHLHFRATNDPSNQIPDKIVDAITTKETYFFRDKTPFDLLREKIIPDQTLDSVNKDGYASSLKIWSAACSTGQELYSIAFILKELKVNSKSINVSLIGSDISDSVIQKAKRGEYNKVEVNRGLSPGMIQRYFSSNTGNWKVNDDIRSMVHFKKMNLLQPLKNMGRFDIILCRNVAIYFGAEDKKKLFHKIADQLRPNGVLLIGSTESILDLSDRFERKKYMDTVYYTLNSK